MVPLRQILHLSSEDTRRVPWKNGRGVTHELALWPTEAGFERDDYDWRISSARVDEAGAFSMFPGIDRILVVVGGSGMLLSHGEAGALRVRALEPHRFRGDECTIAELPTGPVVDFNVLTRRGRCKATVEVLSLGKRRARAEIGGCPRDHAFLHLLAGLLEIRATREENPFHLRSQHSLWVQNVGLGEEFDLVGKTAETLALLVRITPESDPG